MTKEEKLHSIYEKTIDLYINEGNALWTKFSAVILFHTILILAIVQIIQNRLSLSILPIAFSIIGILCGIIWFFLLERSLMLYDYWIYSAKEMEQMLSYYPNLITRADKFSQNDEIKFDLNGKIKEDTSKKLPVRLHTGILSKYTNRFLLKATSILCISAYIVILITLILHK